MAPSSWGDVFNKLEFFSFGIVSLGIVTRCQVYKEINSWGKGTNKLGFFSFGIVSFGIVFWHQDIIYDGFVRKNLKMFVIAKHCQDILTLIFKMN